MPTNILMPALSPTMTEGTLAKWLKKEGDKVKSGDVIAEIETDKATMEVEAADEGVLAKIMVAAGTAGVKVNAPIAVLLEEGEDASALSKVPPAANTSETVMPAKAGIQPAISPQPSRQEMTPGLRRGDEGDRIFATPLAKRIAAERGVNLATIKGSGPHGRITREDVLAGKSNGNGIQLPATTAQGTALAHPKATGEVADMLTKMGQTFTAIPNNNIKKVTAKRLLESKQTIPHFYLTIDCRMDHLLAMRKRINETGIKVSVNDFVIRAVALALKEVPAANAAWTDDAVLRFNEVDVSVAVATPNGLITPIIKNADKKGLSAISEEMKELAEKARTGKLKPEEFMGGGFTISNLGMFGIKDFAAIINPPQSCILAVGAGEQRPVVNGGAIEIATVMSCTLSVDHRSVDGSVGAEFLAAFRKRIEDPALMLL